MSALRSLVISDLHLGGVARSDVLRRRALRAPLLAAAAQVDRVVLLGDSLELRHGPPREALAAARPLFEELGEALSGRELVVVAGNHDHALIAPWLMRRGEEDAPAALSPQQLLDPAEASPMLVRLAEWAAPARVVAAYPGLWLREDVYATHGHYLDCHLTIPTLERLSVGVMSRMLGRPADEFDSVADYEAVTGPVYAWRQTVARDARTGSTLNGIATVHAWRALGGGGRRGSGRDGSGGRRRHGAKPARTPRSLASRLRRRALVGAFPLAVAALNHAGVGPLRAEISGTELRRAGLRAMGEVAARLELGDAYVVFGHTHRAGPLSGDDQQEWRGAPDGASRARLVNTGCWTYDRVFLTSNPGESPYWPGTCVMVGESGPPALERLLADRSHAELTPSPA